MELHYAIGDCTLGKLLVASNGKGVCAVLLGEDRDVLLSDLNRRFRSTDKQESSNRIALLLTQVADHIRHPGSNHPTVKLDPQGTPFQQQVWSALRQIPVGNTITYQALAERIGAPRAVRAVAGACAANPIAVLIPCHRVLRSDGGLSGYRWGVERKRALLEAESTTSIKSPIFFAVVTESVSPKWP